MKQKKPSFIKRVLRTLITLGVIAGAVALLGAWRLGRWADTPKDLAEPVQVEIRRGTGLSELAHQLNESEVLDQPLFFHLWVKFFSSYPKFQAGLYRFEGETSPRQIANTIIAGKIYEPVVLQFTIPEGFNMNLIAKRLAANGVGSPEQNMALFRNESFLKSINVPSKTIEGFFFPATYQFVRVVSPVEAARHAVETFWKNLPPNYEQAVQAKGLSLLQAVTFASMIEVETKHTDEKPKVAEVIWRRLKNKEPLGIDAALIYGIADYGGDIKRSHLADPKNPYNNRIYRGLPPTPISCPDVSSLTAVLNPTNEGYYYYVYDVDTVDRHHFSKTLAEHNRYVKKLVSATRGRRH